MTAKAFSVVLRAGAALSVLAAVTVGTAAAQASSMGLGRATATPCLNPPFILITYPRAPERRLATNAQIQLRSAVDAVISRKDACVVGQEQSDRMLTTSGFAIDSVLSTQENLDLAKAMRADELIEFEVTQVGPSGKLYQFNGRLVLARDINLRETIPAPEPDANLSSAAKWFVKNIIPVRAQFAHEQKCLNLSREQKFAEAEAAARAGISAYPAATISRLCLAVALRSQKKPAAEVLGVIEEVRRRDPNNTRALVIALDSYFDSNNQDKYAEIAAHLVGIDPANSAIEIIVENLALWKKTDIAMPVIEQALQTDPDNRGLLSTRFRLLYGGNKWKEAVTRGEELAKIDSNVVDTLFINRMVSAYANDSQPQRVLAWLGRGVKKYPDNIEMTRKFAAQLRSLGQVPQAIEAYKTVLQRNPKEPEVRLRIAQLYGELNEADSSLAWLRKAADAGVDSKETISQLVYAAAARLMRAASESKAADDYKKAIPLLAYSDSVFANDNAKFQWGFALLQIGFSVYQQKIAEPNKPTCEAVKEAAPLFDTANEKVRAGGKANPTAAGGYMNNILQLQQILEQVRTQLRCTL